MRMQRDREYHNKPKGYLYTYSVLEVDSGEILFRCDVVGHATSHELMFTSPSSEPVFSMKPNRKIMPTAWPITDAKNKPVGQIVRKILGKGVWVAMNLTDSEVFRIVDAEQALDKVGRAVFGGVSEAYGFLRDDVLLATTKQEPREKVAKSGIRGFVQAFLTTSDWVVRFSPEAPLVDIRFIAAAMVLLIDMTQTA
jgi:hypothetical protein